MIKHIWAVYFSPSGKTKQVTMAVAEGAAGVLKIGEIHTYDFTLLVCFFLLIGFVVFCIVVCFCICCFGAEDWRDSYV